MKNKKQPYYGHDGKTNEEQMRAQQEEFLLNDQPPVFNPFKEQQVHRSGLFMMNGLAKASIAVLVILAFFLLGLFIGDFFAPSKSAIIGYYHTSIEDIYYASETIAVGTVVEVINPTEVRGRPYSNFNIALRENRLLKGTLTSGNEPPYLNIYQNKNDFKNKNGSYLKDKKEYLLFCGATFPNATREVRLINPLQGALEIKKDHIVKNKYSKMLGVAGMSVTEVMEQIKSIKKPLSCAPEVGTVPDLDAPVSSEAVSSVTSTISSEQSVSSQPPQEQNTFGVKMISLMTGPAIEERVEYTLTQAEIEQFMKLYETVELEFVRDRADAQGNVPAGGGSATKCSVKIEYSDGRNFEWIDLPDFTTNKGHIAVSGGYFKATKGAKELVEFCNNLSCYKDKKIDLFTDWVGNPVAVGRNDGISQIEIYNHPIRKSYFLKVDKFDELLGELNTVEFISTDEKLQNIKDSIVIKLHNVATLNDYIFNGERWIIDGKINIIKNASDKTFIAYLKKNFDICKDITV